MAKNTNDPNSPLVQEGILADGGTDAVVDRLGDPSMRTNLTRPVYPESEATVQDFDGPPSEPKPFVAPAPSPADTVRLGEDGRTFGANDSTISDDAMGPANVPWSSPDYGLPRIGYPDDGWGPYGEDAPTGLPPGSFRGAVHISDPQCKPTNHTMLGGDDV